MLSSTAVFSQDDDEPLNVAEWRSAIEILNGAKALLQEIGWQQGARSDVPENCLATALERSWLKLGKSIVDFEYARAALNQAIGVSDLSAQAASISDMPKDPLAVPYWGRYYMYWNDADGRTIENALSAFDRALEHAHVRLKDAYAAQKTGDDVFEYDQSLMRALGLTK